MTVTYTNRKGTTYFLNKGVTKTGKPRYTFAREQKNEPVAVLPDGYEIRPLAKVDQREFLSSRL
jgi:hypothetical protein